MRLSLFFSLIIVTSCSSLALGQLPSGWKAHDLNRPAPRVVTPAEQVAAPPSDATVLFNGTDLSNWQSRDGSEAKWRIVEEAMQSIPNSGYVVTKEKFGDCQLHVEFATPPNVQGKGQGRGNSGVFLMDEFEIQVLDSFENLTYSDGSGGSIYGQYPPLVNVSRKPGQWQSYDIIFRRPRFSDNGKLLKPAIFTVLQNGVLIHDSAAAFGPTDWIQHAPYSQMEAKTEGPVALQDHGNPVRFRNIWIRPLAENQPQPAKPYDPQLLTLNEDGAKKLVGEYGKIPVKFENGNLFLYFNNKPLEMIPRSQTEFGFRKTAGIVRFELDENGEGESLELRLDASGTQTAKREK